MSPALEAITKDTIVGDLWTRPGLAPRDRSLVTVGALAAAGQNVQSPYHLNRAMDAGLAAEQAGEVSTHLAFYAGCSNASLTVPVVKEVLNNRNT